MQSFRLVIWSIFITLATCSSIICGAACDLGEVGECAGSGGVFGPCDDHLAFLCLHGLTCERSKAGSICLPPASAAGDVAASDCAAWRGKMSCDDDLCFLACDGPDDCFGSTVCDEFAGMCVYPDDVQ